MAHPLLGSHLQSFAQPPDPWPGHCSAWVKEDRTGKQDWAPHMAMEATREDSKLAVGLRLILDSDIDLKLVELCWIRSAEDTALQCHPKVLSLRALLSHGESLHIGKTSDHKKVWVTLTERVPQSRHAASYREEHARKEAVP